MKTKDCKHKDTRKLFYQDKNKWIRTDISMCLDCNKIVQMGEVKNE